MGNVRLYGSTSGYTELAPPAVAPDGVLSLPSGTGTLALAGDADGPSTLITSESFTAVSSVSVDDCFTSDYKNYMIIVDITNIASGSSVVNLRGRVSGTDRTDEFYGGSLKINHSSTPLIGQNINAVTEIAFGAISDVASTNILRSVLTVHAPQLAEKTSVEWETINYDGSYFQKFLGGVLEYPTTTQLDGFSIYPTVRTFTGSLNVYGYKD